MDINDSKTSQFFDNSENTSDVFEETTSTNVENDTSVSNGYSETLISDGTSISINSDDNNESSAQSSKNLKRTKREQYLKKKRAADEEYQKVLVEQHYKRLMHLLQQSQFYSKFITQKISNDYNLTNPLNNLDGLEKGYKREGSRPMHKTTAKRKIQPYKDHTNYDVKSVINNEEIQERLQRTKKKLTKDDIEEYLKVMSDEENESPNGKVLYSPMKKELYEPFVQSKLFRGELRKYQKDGVQWLKALHENGLNGILADEMGLGKTIQIIAFLCYLIDERTQGPYLIVAPLSTLSNWQIEFEHFAPHLPLILFYGDKEKQESLHEEILKKYAVNNVFYTKPIVLTSYEIVMANYRFLSRQKWQYIVIDEAQRIKNPCSELSKVLRKIPSVHRLLMTGTPLQNNLKELWSLLNFLLPEFFDDLAVFESWLDVKELQDKKGTERFLKLEEEKRVICTLREILKPFILRRTKDEVCLDLPSKKEVIVYAPLSELQNELYRVVLNFDSEALSKTNKSLIIETVDGQRPKRKCTYDRDYRLNFAKENENVNKKKFISLEGNNKAKEENELENSKLQVFKRYIDVNDSNRDYLIKIKYTNKMMSYRKIVNHPYLLHFPCNRFGNPLINKDLIKASGKLMVLDQMLTKLHHQKHKVLLFSTMTTMLDVIEDYLTLKPYKYVRLDGSSAIESRTASIKQFNEDPKTFLFLLSTRAGGVGLNLMAADTVIIYDSHWNPQVDLQAMARCHRIGQSRPVMIIKLCTKATIDEEIIKRGEAKRKLEKAVISKQNISFQLTTKENISRLMQILESSDNSVVKAEDNAYYTDAEMEKLLDRSSFQQNNSVEQNNVAKSK